MVCHSLPALGERYLVKHTDHLQLLCLFALSHYISPIACCLIARKQSGKRGSASLAIRCMSNRKSLCSAARHDRMVVMNALKGSRSIFHRLFAYRDTVILLPLAQCGRIHRKRCDSVGPHPAKIWDFKDVKPRMLYRHPLESLQSDFRPQHPWSNSNYFKAHRPDELLPLGLCTFR